MRLILIVLFCLSPLFAAAETEQELIARMEVAGTNEGGGERHSVSVKNCTMTTFRWKEQEDGSWPLWTSFVFYMPYVRILEMKDNEHFAFIENERVPEESSAIIGFKRNEGGIVTQEYPVIRMTKEPSKPSPRGDGTTHRIREIEGTFMIVQKGRDVGEKAKAFTQAFHAYVRAFCTPVG